MPRENARDKFVHLAEKRVVRAIHAIRLVGNLSNRSNYSYTEEDAKKIIRALQTALDEMKTKFSTGRNPGIEFRL